MSKYKVSDLVEFSCGAPRWVQHPDYHDRWISWEVYYTYNKPVIDNHYGLICHVNDHNRGVDADEYWGEAKKDGGVDQNVFYHVIYNNLYCSVKESDILGKVV